MLPTLIFEEMRLPVQMLAAVLVFLCPCAKQRKHFKIRAAGGYLFIVLFSLLYFPVFGGKPAQRFYDFTAAWYALIALLAVIYAVLCFEVTWCDALFFSICAFAAQNMVYCFYHSFIAQSAFPMLRLYLPVYVLGAAVVCGVFYAVIGCCFMLATRRCGGRLFEDTLQNLILYHVMFLAMIVCLFFYQNAYQNRISVFDALAWLSGIMINIFLLVLQYSVIHTVSYARQNASLEQIIKNSEHYYELSKEHIAIINRKCHDLKHQLKALAVADEAERKEYIREAQESILFYQDMTITENEALNAVLAEKGLFCRERGIEFLYSVDRVELSFMRVSDLYAILGNAIDNAIEYAGAQEDQNMRSINLRIKKKNQFIGIQVTNPYAGEPYRGRGLPHTHKADTFSHGIGLKSIRYIAEKYGGCMEISTDDRLFTLQVILPCR